LQKRRNGTHRITTLMAVETDIITGSSIEQAVILVIMYVETFKIEVIVFISTIIKCLLSCRPIIFSNQKFVDTDYRISFSNMKGKLPINFIADSYYSQKYLNYIIEVNLISERNQSSQRKKLTNLI
jgi:hypothetical protein